MAKPSEDPPAKKPRRMDKTNAFIARVSEAYEAFGCHMRGLNCLCDVVLEVYAGKDVDTFLVELELVQAFAHCTPQAAAKTFIWAAFREIFVPQTTTPTAGGRVPAPSNSWKWLALFVGCIF